MVKAIGAIVAAALLTVAILCGQTVTGSIVGSVSDPTGLPVSEATVTLMQMATGASREMKTGERGDFVFAGLEPGEYALAVTAAGFKKAERKQVMLSPAERLPVGIVSMEVGALSESVTVMAHGAIVQTASAERSGVVTNSQVENLLISSRKVVDLLQIMPGVVNLDTSPQIDRYFYVNVQGGRQGTNNLSVDGMPVNNFGNGYNGIVGMSMDSVSEVKVLLTNYQAEYGRNAGANISLISKSGTLQFHGLGSYFKRHEEFNANNFFAGGHKV
jgi:outer membrane receptor protein involved in Fe transport